MKPFSPEHPFVPRGEDSDVSIEPIGGVMGAIVGALLVLILIIVLIFSYSQKRRQRQNYSQKRAMFYSSKRVYSFTAAQNEEYHISTITNLYEKHAQINCHPHYPCDKECTSRDNMYSKHKDYPSALRIQNVIETSMNTEQSTVEPAVISSSNSPNVPCLMDTSDYQVVCNRFCSQITPECVTPTATLLCTSKEMNFVDKTNEFGLKIPEGAIPEGKSVTIDIGVALYGPSQFPEGLRPVSPVFWVCIRDQKLFQFLKPVEVIIPHCINLENLDDIESLGLTFLKGDHETKPHQMYQFQQIEGGAFFKKCGVLETTHFCYLCISSKISKETIERAMFCVYAAIPCVMSPQKPVYVYFFVTFLLSTCLETLKKQISRIPELSNHIVKKNDFQFSTPNHPTLEIVLPKSPPAGWTVGLQFNKQVSWLASFPGL